MTSRITVRQIDQSGLDALLPAYAEAFADEPLNVWIMGGEVPEEHRVAFFRDLLRRALAGDEVWAAELDGAIRGSSTWIPADSADRFHAEAAELAAMAEIAGTAALGRAATVARLTAERHPTAAGHLYFHSLAVQPGYRGSGVGSAIMRERLAIADAERMPTYLEASNEGSARLVRRFGFEPTGEPIRLPGGGPALIPMWRDPVC
ncbi:GNAT family N-acetyltransferase [Glycomyces sp. L485]|uniref:GNAT family N-acetyltransferase n=1 Tax=Glycomyces sp. L485 TaxID=2909235 RepID=UPI001F4AA9D0|nr:GNAT family N-acetyltransferase [Glycomyces sp. L485]MCH7231985.1 GNAT family N-acetyltransferase [Glycomyces sp. L485]